MTPKMQIKNEGGQADEPPGSDTYSTDSNVFDRIISMVFSTIQNHCFGKTAESIALYYGFY